MQKDSRACRFDHKLCNYARSTRVLSYSGALCYVLSMEATSVSMLKAS